MSTRGYTNLLCPKKQVYSMSKSPKDETDGVTSVAACFPLSSVAVANTARRYYERERKIKQFLYQLMDDVIYHSRRAPLHNQRTGSQ